VISSVSDTGSNSEENIVRAVTALGRSKPRLTVFEAIYFHKKPVKTVEEIAERTGLSRKDVLTHGKHLVGSELAIQLKVKGDTAYRVIPFYQHHKPKILRLVADPSKLEKVATKRNTVVSAMVRPASVPKRELRKRKTLSVLYMFANPDPDPDPKKKYIRPDAEAKRVLEAIRGSKYRDNVRLEIRPAAGLQTVLDGLNDHAPQVVHFSGHGHSAGILADNGAIGAPATQDIPFQLLSDALAAVDRPPRVAVFNSCYSAAGRQKVLKSVPVMIGMSDSISDTAAVAFATQFYAALASGNSVRSAFNQGVIAVSMVSLDEKETAKLFERDGFDASSLTLT
jgi:hypothetical protein